MTLTPDDFGAFFEEIHGHSPFPWQTRLLRKIDKDGRWPNLLDLPTGSGKTAALDIAVFHLALEAAREVDRRAAVRIAFVVDRRLVVDDAYARARRIREALRQPKGRVTEEVGRRLRALAGDEAPDAAPLLTCRLRGGIPRESDWARTPSQPTILCSTVDQIGSRLLFRGYGVSDSMKPVHAGLIGCDCLVLLDEAHLAEPFRQTLDWIARYQGEAWRPKGFERPATFALLTATPGRTGAGFHLEAEDFENPVLSSRLRAGKPVRLVKSGKITTDDDAGGEENGKAVTARDDLAQRVRAIVAEVDAARRHFADPQNGATAPAIAVVVNRVARARGVHTALLRLMEGTAEQAREPILMIGAARSFDRDVIADELQPIRTRTWGRGETRRLDGPIVIVATQCIEAGVDIDLDAVITEAAPIDALRQRFGRLNRAGRDLRAFGAVVAMSSDLSTRYEDPVYDKTIKSAWDYLSKIAEKQKGAPPVVDLGVSVFSSHEQSDPVPPDAIAKKADAPVLLPAHLDLLSQTSPVPAVDPEVALYLHGPERQPDAVSVIWRADIDATDVDVRALLTLVPPRPAEAIDLPVWAVRRWLVYGSGVDLSDLPAAAPAADVRRSVANEVHRAFLWKGDSDDSRWITPDAIRPGATVVVPAGYKGLDRFGWNPDSDQSVVDIARETSLGFSGRRFAVRLAPGLLGSDDLNPLVANVVAERKEGRWSDLRDALLELPLPENLRTDLERLDEARRRKVVFYTDLYGRDAHERPRGVVFSAPMGLVGGATSTELQPSATEDDTAGSLPGYSLSLETHSQDVERYAELFARGAGLPAVHVADLKLAGYLHDAGKRDRRFQAWLQYGDPLGPDPETVLAKSSRRLPGKARTASGLPERWRHEAYSVRLARSSERLASANDPMLVLWLVGTHHGFGRPFFPHQDPLEPPGDVGPQSLAFEWRGLDWASIFERLKARYGAWGLAHMEAIVRLADHRASEVRAEEEGAG